MTQCERILDYISKFGSISTMEAFTDLGVTRLASRIYDLKQAGYVFDEITESRNNRFGKRVSYTRYSMR